LSFGWILPRLAGRIWSRRALTEPFPGDWFFTAGKLAHRDERLSSTGGFFPVHLEHDDDPLLPVVPFRLRFNGSPGVSFFFWRPSFFPSWPCTPNVFPHAPFLRLGPTDQAGSANLRWLFSSFLHCPPFPLLDGAFTFFSAPSPWGPWLPSLAAVLLFAPGRGPGRPSGCRAFGFGLSLAGYPPPPVCPDP